MSEYNPFEGYRLTSPLGLRKHPLPPHKVKFHRGVDLVLHPKDANGIIRAKVAGEVMHAKFGVANSGIFPEMGIVVAIKTKDGCLHLYAHLSAALVKVGQKVDREQAIGRQGTTGKNAKGESTSSGNHLHYEIRKKSSPMFGWTKADDCVHEPTQYLMDYYLNEKEAEEEMEALKLITALEERITALETLVEAPVWFIKEFGSADLGGKIYDPRFTEQDWRAIAVVLRVR